MIRAEEVFMRMARRKKWYVFRPSWPDFLCLDRQGNPFAVEVKDGPDWASENQYKTFEFLTDHEILKVFMWHREAPSLFMPWERFKDARPARKRYENAGPKGSG